MPGNVKARLLELVEAAPEWHPSETSPVETFPEATEAEKDARAARRRRGRDDDSSSSLDDTGGGRRPSARGPERLLAQFWDNPLYRDTAGATYIEIDDRLYSLDAKNRELRELLSYSAHMAGKGAGSDAVSQSIAVLSHRARTEGVDLEMFTRIGEADGAIYYDLGNGRAVKITSTGWQVVPRPLWFRTFPHQLPQPDPERSGDLWQVFNIVNVAPESRLLFLCLLVALFVPRIIRPLIHLFGCQGAGKSFTARIVKMFFDPSPVALSMIPRNIEELALLFFRNALVFLDNASSFPPVVADFLCAFISGASFEMRALFTDYEARVFSPGCTVGVTSITDVHGRPDLTERTIKIPLERLTKERRRTERELIQEFEAALPGMLGGVFDLLSCAMAIHPTLNLKELPRMADFATWGYAIAEAVGPGRGREFLRAYADNTAMQTADLHETDTLLAAIVQRMDTAGELEGNFREVLSILHEIAQPAKNDRSFPSSARSFRGHLERLRVPLLDMGITFTIRDGRTNRGRIVTFAKSYKGPESAAWGAVNQEPAPFAEVEDLEFSDDELSHEG